MAQADIRSNPNVRASNWADNCWISEIFPAASAAPQMNRLDIEETNTTSRCLTLASHIQSLIYPLVISKYHQVRCLSKHT